MKEVLSQFVLAFWSGRKVCRIATIERVNNMYTGCSRVSKTDLASGRQFSAEATPPLVADFSPWYTDYIRICLNSSTVRWLTETLNGESTLSNL